MKRATTLGDRLDQRIFDAIYRRALVYNTCWEDPAVDRRALDLRHDDTLLVITSAGCNVLDYALCGVERIHAVDANPRQTALLELKLAGIRRLAFDDFFDLFGRGRSPRFREMYHDALRDDLSPTARTFWDERIHWFQGATDRDSFYFRGLSGSVARAFHGYLAMRPGLRDAVDGLLAARSLDEQRELYDARIRPMLWTRAMNWMLSRQVTMSMLGVPHPQRREVERQHSGGVAGFIRESLEYVVRQLPLASNYFWTVYLRGTYTPDCCPEYLRPENFAALKRGLVDRISPYTCTVTGFLQWTDASISKFVLLDHMDWMASYHPELLAEEWEAIVARATPDARVIFRSAHADAAYLDHIRVMHQGRPRQVRDLLRFHRDLARHLSHEDRVHTYAGFHIGDLQAA